MGLVVCVLCICFGNFGTWCIWLWLPVLLIFFSLQKLLVSCVIFFSFFISFFWFSCLFFSYVLCIFFFLVIIRFIIWAVFVRTESVWIGYLFHQNKLFCLHIRFTIFCFSFQYKFNDNSVLSSSFILTSQIVLKLQKNVNLRGVFVWDWKNGGKIKTNRFFLVATK